MTEPHKQILLAMGIAALAKALFDSPKARPLRRWGSLALAFLGEWRSLAAELRRAPLVNSTPAYSTARSTLRAALIAQESAISGGASS